MSPFVSAAFAHGVDFSADAISALREDGREAWVVLAGWGLAHTRDAGETWTWTCEEALATRQVYGVLALAPGEAVAATAEGPVLVGEGCVYTPIPGLPEGTFTDRAVRAGDGFLLFGAGEEGGGAWECTREACVATPLSGAGLFPKSAYADGDVVWATVVYLDTLASELWRRDAGEWALAYAWPDGDTDPRVLHADGDRVLVWSRPRDESRRPALLVSDDGGATFTATFETGYWTDPAPGFLAFEGEYFLGSVYGARTWCSRDAGRSFTEVSATAPAVRCGDAAGDYAYVCADHLADGFDVARAPHGSERAWDRVGCLEEAGVAACDDAACAGAYELYVNAGIVGGGQCDVEPEPPPVDDASPCGCGGGAQAALLLLLWRRRC